MQLIKGADTNWPKNEVKSVATVWFVLSVGQCFVFWFKGSLAEDATLSIVLIFEMNPLWLRKNNTEMSFTVFLRKTN